MERVLKNVFVIFDAIENHLVVDQFAVWFDVGGGDGQGTARVGRESCVKKNLKKIIFE